MQTRGEFADEIERLGVHLRDTSITILAQPANLHVPGFVCSFIKYQATQAFRISEWLRVPDNDQVDLIAHATRGLFESHLIYGHLMKEGGRYFMKLLIEEIAADYFDVVKSAVGDESNLNTIDPGLAEEYRRMKAMGCRKTPRVSDLAKETGAADEYRRFYAHYSKYSHPSLYQIAGDYRAVFSQHATLLFAERALQYLQAIAVDTDRIREIVLQHTRVTEERKGGP